MSNFRPVFGQNGKHSVLYVELWAVWSGFRVRFWSNPAEYNAKLLVTLRLPRSFKAVAMQFTERR
jgi:hypothetical protein